jgi:hypothetical protein
MGTWGTGAFENDSALDFVSAIQDQGLQLLVAAFDVLPPEDEWLDVQGEDAVAAAEIVAAAFGQGKPGLPPQVQQLVAQHGAAIRAMPGLTAKAVQALSRVTADNSELKELWAEVGDDQAWIAAIKDLERRLDAIP